VIIFHLLSDPTAAFCDLGADFYTHGLFIVDTQGL
jgi:hypothetical protein